MVQKLSLRCFVVCGSVERRDVSRCEKAKFKCQVTAIGGVTALAAGVSQWCLPVPPLLYTTQLTHYVGTYVERLLCLQCKPVNLICQALLADLRNGMTF